jgi:DNA-binding MarR family transcriptional regulator
MAISHQQVQEIRFMTMIMHKISRQAMQQGFTEKGIDLTMLQYGMLNMVQMNSCTMADLSRKMGLDPSTLVSSVDALVKKGYISRERDPQDRRRYPLRLTDSGLELLKHLRETFGGDPLSLALEQLEASELEQLQVLLRKVVVVLPEGEKALKEMTHHLRMHNKMHHELIDSKDS